MCFFSEKLRPQKKISVCDKFQPRQGHHQIVCIASLKKELITKSSVFNFWWTFVFYHVLKRWHDQRGRGLKRLINTKWKESWELLSDVVNMWALDQRSLSFTVIFSQLHFLGLSFWLMIAWSKITVMVISIYCHLLLFTNRILSLKSDLEKKNTTTKGG